MLNLKTSPVGIDKSIQGFQQFLYTKLKAKWSVTDSEYDSFGRCYRNQVDAGYIPEVFVSASSENNTIYKEAWFDDTLHKAVSFFDSYDEVKYDNGTSQATVDLIFIVNIPFIKPGIEHRADEEVRRDVEQLCAMPRFNFTMKEFRTGYQTVFSRFDGWIDRDQTTFRDMHPIHVFAIRFNLIYDINDC